MSNELKDAIQKIQNKKINNKTVEKSLSTLVDDYGGENYYNAVQLLSQHLGNVFLFTNYISTINTDIELDNKVILRVSFTKSSNEHRASFVFYTKEIFSKILQATDDDNQKEFKHYLNDHLGKLNITADGEVSFDYGKFNGDTNDRIIDLIVFKNLWKNANVATELIRLLEDLL
jgi:hypothetical protein